jgi:hypothetical protein
MKTKTNVKAGFQAGSGSTNDGTVMIMRTQSTP